MAEGNEELDLEFVAPAYGRLSRGRLARGAAETAPLLLRCQQKRVLQAVMHAHPRNLPGGINAASLD